MLRKFSFAFAALTVVCLGAYAQADHVGMTAQLRGEYRIGEPGPRMDPAGWFAYNNSTGFSGLASTNGGSAVQSGNTITRLVADDINLYPAAVGMDLAEWGWSAANLNADAVSVRMRIRFYADNANMPGAYLTGFTFNPLTLNPGSVSNWYATVAPGTFIMPAKFWAGITFDNNTGATGATQAQMDNLGVGLYGVPTVGTSADQMFHTNAAGSFLGNNPPGSLYNFSGNPLANAGWYFKAVPEPSSIAAIGTALMGLAGLKLRRRS